MTCPPTAPLFHGTGVYCLAAILASDELLEGVHWGKPGEPHGPRLSRRYEAARDFILYNMHWGEGGVLALDANLLASDFQLAAYQDTQYGGQAWEQDEAEVAVCTPKVGGLSKYLFSVICHPGSIEAALQPERMLDAMAECGWPYPGDDQVSMDIAAEHLKALAAHPLLNAWLPGSHTPPVHGNWADDLPQEPRQRAQTTGA